MSPNIMNPSNIMPPNMPNPPAIPLRDYHLPDPTSIWPIAIGWWILAALLIAGIIVAVVSWLHYRRRTAYRREALKVLEALPLDQHFIAQANTLLKQVSLSAAQHTSHQTSQTNSQNSTSSAGLTGSQWKIFLLNQKGLTESQAQLLVEAAYCDPDDQDLTPATLKELQQSCRQWIKQYTPQNTNTGGAPC